MTVNTRLEFDGAAPNNKRLQQVLDELAVSVGSGGTISASDKQVLFMDGTTPTGDVGLAYDKTAKALTIGPVLADPGGLGGTWSLNVGNNDTTAAFGIQLFGNTEKNGYGATFQSVTYRGTIAAPTSIIAGDYLFELYQVAMPDNGVWDYCGQWTLVAQGIAANHKIIGRWNVAWTAPNGDPHAFNFWSPQDLPGMWLSASHITSGFVLTGAGAFGLRVDDTSVNSAGTSLDVGAASIPKLSNLTSNGFVKTSGGDGTLSVQAPPTITGSRGGNAALASLLTALATMGLIVDSTS